MTDSTTYRDCSKIILYRRKKINGFYKKLLKRSTPPSEVKYPELFFCKYPELFFCETLDYFFTKSYT